MGGPSEEAHGMQQGLTLGGPMQFPRPVVDAFSGAVAGGVARVAIAPLDVIKIRFQVWNREAPSKRRAITNRARRNTNAAASLGITPNRLALTMFSVSRC